MKKFFIRLFKKKSSIKFKYYFNKDKELGFVLPQILILSIVVALGILAIGDLIVGVSNDAVNFLTSAVGSKAIPFKTIN